MQGSEALIGYKSLKYSLRKSSTGELQRTVYNMTGVKLIFNTEGAGYKISLENVIFQIAIFISLMLIPKILADFILIYVLRYGDYGSYKYENTLINQKNQEEEESEIGEKEFQKKNDKSSSEEEKKSEEGGGEGESENISLLKSIDSS